MTKSKQYRLWAEKVDADSSKWPVAPGVRVFMIDCEVCGARMAPNVIGPHTRRHLRRGEVVNGLAR